MRAFVLCSGLVAALTVGAAERIAFVGDSITHDGRYLGFVQLAETLAKLSAACRPVSCRFELKPCDGDLR